MIFVFRTDNFHTIWMYNMLFPIDIIWVNSKMRIVDIKTGLRPCSSMSGCQIYVPNEKAKYILEFKDGTMRAKGITKKSKINLG